MAASSPHHQDVSLPESVEMIISRICLEKNQRPLFNDVRKMLAEIGEQASVDVLTKILGSTTPIRSFGGYVRFWVNKDYPLSAAAAVNGCGSPQPSPQTQRMWSPSSNNNTSPFNSPQKLNGGSLESRLSNLSLNSTPSNLHKTSLSSPQSISCQLSFEEETEQNKSSSIGRQSSVPTMTESVKNFQQLMILNKLEYRKLFLLLSYIGRQKLEAVVRVGDAEEIYEIKDLPMKAFEAKIWDKYGKKFCDESDRSQYLDWDSGKTHIYYCYVWGNGSYYFKGPYLNSTKNHLQRSLGDDNILTVKFLEDGEYARGNLAEEGILVGLRHYRFFGLPRKHH